MNPTLATLGQPIIDFSFATTENPHSHFSDWQGKIRVVYFYPKDSTPGCTIESKGFRDHYAAFVKAGACILGVSRDNLKSHAKFVRQCELPFPLISDESEALCQYFSVIKEKSLFGIKALGIERSTFLIDQMGVLRQEWRGVKVLGHVQAVWQAVQTLV